MGSGGQRGEKRTATKNIEKGTATKNIAKRNAAMMVVTMATIATEMLMRREVMAGRMVGGEWLKEASPRGAHHVLVRSLCSTWQMQRRFVI
jgi:hypothetical protein